MPLGSSSATDRTNDRTSVEIIELSRHSWDMLRGLRLNALLDEPEAFVTTWNKEKDQPRTHWEAQFDHKHWVVALDFYDMPVGVAALNFLDGDPSQPWFIESVWVAPAHRRAGVLRQLVERLDKYALDAGVLTLQLWVLETNERAEEAYARLAYTRDNQYDQPTTKARPNGTLINECLMVRPLP